MSETTDEQVYDIDLADLPEKEEDQVDTEPEDDGLSEGDENIEKTEEFPDDAEEIIKPSMKDKTKKRIRGLVNKHKDSESKWKKRVDEQQAKIDLLESKERERSQKESKLDQDSRVNEITRKQQIAYENNDSKSLAELNNELIQVSQSPHSFNSQDIDPDTFFKSNFSWYGEDQKKTNAAIGLDSQLIKDPAWSNRSVSERLTEVGKRTDKMFKTNPYRNSAPSEGAPISRPNKTLTISRETKDFVNTYYHQQTDNEKKKTMIQMTRGINKSEEN